MSRREKRKQFKKKARSIFFCTLIVVSLIAILYSGYQLASYYADHKDAVSLGQELAGMREETFGESAENVTAEAGADLSGTQAADALKTERTSEQIRGFYGKMKSKNPDYVCWITIADTAIDYPVVKRDNSFYLNHDIGGRKNRHGSIFMDETCSPGDEILLIHGHHMKDGTMFGDLKQYKDGEFRKKHGTILLEFEDGMKEYRIFAAAQIDLLDETSFVYEQLPTTAEEKVVYIEGLDDASFWYDEDAVDEDDELLILSTCDYGSEDERLIVAAKEIRGDE